VEKWNCNKDKVEMEEANIQTYYLSVDGNTPGLRCPVCGACYVLEQRVQQLRDGEELLESK
jgi:hypothetical protein